MKSLTLEANIEGVRLWCTNLHLSLFSALFPRLLTNQCQIFKTRYLANQWLGDQPLVNIITKLTNKRTHQTFTPPDDCFSKVHMSDEVHVGYRTSMGHLHDDVILLLLRPESKCKYKRTIKKDSNRSSNMTPSWKSPIRSCQTRTITSYNCGYLGCQPVTFTICLQF